MNIRYEQLFGPAELAVLIKGLRSLNETELADAFADGLAILEGECFDNRRDWKNVSESAKRELDAVGERIGDRLWDLDEKLVALLDEAQLGA